MWQWLLQVSKVGSKESWSRRQIGMPPLLPCPAKRWVLLHYRDANCVCHIKKQKRHRRHPIMNMHECAVAGGRETPRQASCPLPFL